MNMDTKTTIIGGLVAVLVATGGLLWLTQGDPDPTAVDTDETPVVEVEENGRFGYIERIDAVQFFEDGEHILVGEIEMPTPCDLLEHDHLVRESFPEQVHISFNVINEADMCAQVITPARFQITVTASEEATFTADFMGRDVPLNLRPPAPDESPEDFELFFKG